MIKEGYSVSRYWQSVQLDNLWTRISRWNSTLSFLFNGFWHSYVVKQDSCTQGNMGHTPLNFPPPHTHTLHWATWRKILGYLNWFYHLPSFKKNPNFGSGPILPIFYLIFYSSKALTNITNLYFKHDKNTILQCTIKFSSKVKFFHKRTSTTLIANWKFENILMKPKWERKKEREGGRERG